MQNNFTLKQKILQFAQTQGLAKTLLSERLGVARQTLENKSVLTEPILISFAREFPMVSMEWLIRGEGPMLRITHEGGHTIASEPLQTYLQKHCPHCHEKDIELLNCFKDKEKLLLRVMEYMNAEKGHQGGGQKRKSG